MDAITSDVPARLDRLPWSRWHWKVVIALGVSWLLDGLESGSRDALFGAYALAAAMMCLAALVTAFLGVDAERKSLEEVCAPLGCDPDPAVRSAPSQ